MSLECFCVVVMLLRFYTRIGQIVDLNLQARLLAGVLYKMG